MRAPVILAAGLTFPEGPRWRNGRLWFSDFYSHRVLSVGVQGDLRTEVVLPDQPSGLGWLPDGDLLISSMRDLKVLRWNGASLSVHADLAGLAHFRCNDMIVLDSGHAFVGNFGFDPHMEEAAPTDLIVLAPDGTPGIAARDMAFPNGMALLGDGRVLVVAESVGQCLTAFDVGAHAQLSNRRLFARLDGCQPDGICIDDAGNVQVTTMTCNQLVTFAPDGRHLATRDFDSHLWAVAAGDGKLFLCASDHYVEADCLEARSGKILMLE